MARTSVKSTVKPRYISTNGGKWNFGRITSLAIDRGLDFCQLHVDIVRHACDIANFIPSFPDMFRLAPSSPD